MASATGAALAALFAAVCSGESSKVATPRDACGLLTDEGVGAAFARTFNPAEPGLFAGGGQNQGAMTSCTWESPGTEVAGDFGASIRNTVFINPIVWSWPAGGDGSESYMKSFVDAARTGNLPKPEPVTLGEEANWNGETMNVRQGDVTMSLSLSGPVDAEALRTAAESPAKSALSRFKQRRGQRRLTTIKAAGWSDQSRQIPAGAVVNSRPNINRWYKSQFSDKKMRVKSKI